MLSLVPVSQGTSFLMRSSARGEKRQTSLSNPASCQLCSTPPKADFHLAEKMIYKSQPAQISKPS
jgi:hypothetical protein